MQTEAIRRRMKNERTRDKFERRGTKTRQVFVKSAAVASQVAYVQSHQNEEDKSKPSSRGDRADALRRGSFAVVYQRRIFRRAKRRLL